MINILAININNEVKEPYKVQDILTMYGNIIKTRLGLSCLEEDESGLRGVIVLEILCDKNDEQFLTLQEQLLAVDGLKLGVIHF